MSFRHPHIILLTIIFLGSHSCFANVYIVIYATCNGRTGHAGIAMDNYSIQVRTSTSQGSIRTSASQVDTVADGTLTYYDLWPAEDHFGLFNLSTDRQALYYRLPNAIWPKPLTLSSFYDIGIPHREHYPPDALLMLRTLPISDYLLKDFLDSLIRMPHPFNPRHYNCSDFVIRALLQVTGKHIRAREFMPFSFTTTPNKLCRRLMHLPGTVVLKNPGDKIKGAFLWEKVFAKKPPPSFLVTN